MYTKLLLSVSVAYALKLLICQTVCVKQVGSWLTVNIVKVHAQSKPIQQSFGLSASLAWVGMMFAYKTDNWDEHECQVHDNSLTLARMWQLVQITHSVPAEGAEAGCQRRHSRKTVAVVKSAASFESDCDTVHITHLVERMRMWADIVRRPSLIVTPSSRTTDNNSRPNQLCHGITHVFCRFILVQTTCQTSSSCWHRQYTWWIVALMSPLQCWFAKRMTSNLVQFYVSQKWQIYRIVSYRIGVEKRRLGSLFVLLLVSHFITITYHSDWHKLLFPVPVISHLKL